jgi:16S rRNA G1207 methylase RsmC
MSATFDGAAESTALISSVSIEAMLAARDRVVIMNPPFANGQEVEHVLHAWRFVKPGGRLVAVMSASAPTRSTALYRALQELVAAEGGTFTPLPSGSFKEACTNVETVALVLDK